MATDVERAFNALNGKTAGYTEMWNYYDGKQPVVYTNKRLEEVFRGLDANFTENWCAVVIDSLQERIELQRLVVSDAGAQTALDNLWLTNSLNLEADDAHLAALVTGEAFLIAWQDEGGETQVYYNDPRLCHVFYDPENPRQPTLAAKWWDTDDGKRRMTLYYADRLEYYISQKPTPTSGKAFEPWDEPQAPNPFGVIPVFHLRTGHQPVSELTNVIPLQNGVNKLLIDMMVAAEFGAFKQRYVISGVETRGKLKNAPSEVWDLPAGDGVGQGTEVGEFSATDLNNYLAGVDKLAMAIGVISRTPKHFFFTQGGDPSGEALIAMEAPLNAKALRRIARFTPAWQHLAAFMLELEGFQVEPQDVQPLFRNPQTVQPLTQSQIRQYSVTSGIPLVTELRREGWTEAELDQMDEDKAAAQAAAQASQQQFGEQLLTAFEQGK